MNAPIPYVRRIVDRELDELMPGLAAIALDGPKGVGKTETARQRAATIWALDDERVLEQVRLDSGAVLRSAPPVLVDEWQRHPPVWDQVRRAVDARAASGSYLLTGSLVPDGAPIHSGAGRIVSVRMRPMSLLERGVAYPFVSLTELLRGTHPTPPPEPSRVELTDYVDEILRSGFPGMRDLPERAHRAQLDTYLEHMTGREQELFDTVVRRPATMRAWLAAYGASTSTTATWERIRSTAASTTGELPAKATALAYRELLQRAWLLDEIPGWIPTRNHLTRLAAAPKHQLADPALTARLLGIDRDALVATGVRGSARDARMLGQLFESLVTLDVLVYAQACEARVSHLRTKAGEHEIDLIVEGSGGRVVACEVKLTATPTDDDVKHLNWLERQIGDDLVDKVCITAGQFAYRRPHDNVLVVPAALLGP